MTTNSVVLKSTIFPEWYSDRIQPWIHYIPIKADLTDLYDVMTFFKEHDDLAKQIAVEGTLWSKTFWRREDMIAYQFRYVIASLLVQVCYKVLRFEFFRLISSLEPSFLRSSSST